MPPFAISEEFRYKLTCERIHTIRRKIEGHEVECQSGRRLPAYYAAKDFADEIGHGAEIFETQHHNRRALLVTFREGEEPSEVIQPDSRGIQLLPRVIQPTGLKSIESRFSELESEIKQLKESIFSKDNLKAS